MRTWAIGSVVLASCSPIANRGGPPPMTSPAGLTPGPTESLARKRTAPPLPRATRPWTLPGGARVDIRVDPSKEIARATPLHFGNNVAWFNGKDWFRSAPTMARAKASGIRFWRWPGGSSSDSYRWDGSYAAHVADKEGGDPARMNQSWAVGTDDFIELCRGTGSEAIVTVNYAAARYATAEQAADLAARWVHYFNVERHFKVRYWEIGNEVYGSWEEGHKVPNRPDVTGRSYGEDFLVFAKAMRKVDPNILVGAVAVDEDNGDDWSGYRWWMRDMLPVVAESADFLVEHNYFVWPFDGDKFVNPSNESLFGNLGKIGKARANIDAMVKKYSRRTTPLPIMMTEFNVANASPPQTIQLVGGLFVAEALGEMIRTGYLGSNFWDWKNGLDARLGGDHGMLASSDGAVPDGTPRPAFYTYVLYDKAFGDRMVESSSSDVNLRVYASMFADGEPGLVVVNQGTRPVTVSIDLGPKSRKGTVVGWILDGSDPNAKQVRWNGEGGPTGGGGPFPIESIPPYARDYDSSRPVDLELPASSASGIVFY